MLPMSETDLELLQEFVNTRDIERGRDAVGSPEQLRSWLVARGLLNRNELVPPDALARALAVREGIRALGRANNGEPMDAAAIAAMNRAASSVPLTVTVQPLAGDGAWSLRPGTPGVDGFVGRMLGTLTAAMADGTWSRVKACRNDTCRWLFVDHSRNRSGTWCTMALCGSRMKARAYRARRRESAGV
jgi:predicted RNA-binding Zn ribbon-like protein